MKNKKISIKPSPVIIVKRLIVIELLVALIIVLLFFFVDLLLIYEKIPFENISATTFAIIILVLLQLLFLVSTFLGWFFDNYEMTKEKIVHKRGVIIKKKKIQNISSLASITQTQGLVGKWLNYASIELVDESGDMLMIIPDVYNPKDEIENIEKLLSIKPVDYPKLANQKLEEIIKKGENKNLEFKATFRWDIKKGAVNKDIEHVIVKSVTAFMNSDGGRLLIGVNDKGEIVGLEKDYETLKKKDSDGFENHMTTTFSSLVGPEYAQYFTVAFEKSSGKDVCIVDVVKSNEPVFIKTNDSEKFYVRAGNSVRELNVREAFKYIRTNFDNYSG